MSLERYSARNAELRIANATPASEAERAVNEGVVEGQVLAGKYRVERVLGRGGMGVVVAAHHIQLDEKVAIKFLLPEAVANAEVVGRFVREARAAVRIKSEHVARVSDVGTLEGGEPYMVMEYLEGSDLSVWLQQRGALPIEQAVEFVLQASEAIAEAHALGIVHRDLKPANLFVVRRADGLLSIKVLDFGISKVSGPVGAAEGSMTRTSAVMGSPLYMPPEQMAASRNVDARSDIWALGVILYELISGKSPFMGETLPEVCVKIATEPPSPIRTLRPDVPLEIEAVILRCLAKDREGRYANIAVFAHALAEFGPKRARGSVDRIMRTIQAAGLSASALELPPSSDATTDAAQAATAGTGTEAPWGRTMAAPHKSSRAVAVTGGAVLLVAALGGLVFGLKRGQPSVVSPAGVDATSKAAALVPPGSVAAPPVAVDLSVLEPAVEKTPPPVPTVPSSASSAPVVARTRAVKKGAATKSSASPLAGQPPAPVVPLVADPKPIVASTPAPKPKTAPTGNVFDDR